jgi:hypothetical protein
VNRVRSVPCAVLEHLAAAPRPDEFSATEVVRLASASTSRRRGASTMTSNWAIETKDGGAYAEVNGLNMYYETHGAGRGPR